jgi:hypothetical protein
MKRSGVVAIAIAALAVPAIHAQQRPLSPAGSAATQVGGSWVKTERGQRYQDGKWIEITYGRPIKRGRDLFGSGADYGKTLNAGAPVWRAGANVSTRLETEVPLQIGGKTVPAGEYSLFVDLTNDKEWTLIVSSWPAQEKYDPNNKEALWGAFSYTPDKDVARAAMKVNKLPYSVDQFTIAFTDMTATGGTIAMMWDTTIATVPFTIAS